MGKNILPSLVIAEFLVYGGRYSEPDSLKSLNSQFLDPSFSVLW